MKKLLLFLSVCLSVTSLFAQNKTSVTLERDLKSQPRQWQEILVVGTERVDATQFYADHRVDYASKEAFTSGFLKELHNQSINRDLWLKELDQLGLKYELLHTFWSVNIVAIYASPKTIRYLATRSEVYWMEEIKERKIEWVKPVSMKTTATRSVNGKEKGIEAVKGDSLWLLGYTGKGSKLLTFDTGVWPNHPTLRDQFLGNHVPMSQAWLSYDTYFPGDKSGSHGTHVTGTCLGLDPANNDTIGLAFNAYFMATDPIVQSLANVKTAFEIMKAFEWALNPDGDLNTTTDMPNVINNSWGRPYAQDDSVACDGWVNDLFVTIEMAGIVSIHSAGNEGPGASTIGYPAVSNASVVNNFSIGAVNGNTASFPIASFSSRGPSICGDTGSLLIKPEVVAPGVNVRSGIRNSDGSYGYGNFQGTSMAAPHVSGVSLLLTEAFPQASATEIKESLFYTAKDLGAPGEDNTFGMGMIDALAAYHYLSNLYTPAIPLTNNFDIRLAHFDMIPYSNQCAPTQITAYFANTTDVPNGSLQFEYGVVGGTPQYFNNNSGTFATNDSVVFDVSSLVQPGWNEFYVRTRYYGQQLDFDTINNSRYVIFWVNDAQVLPYQEKFEGVPVFESSMYVGNPDERQTWDTMVVPTMQGISNVATMKLGAYTPRGYQHDYLLTPNLKLVSPTSLTLTFDLSYKLKFNGFKDSLMVSVSTDCGKTWDAPIYAKGPDSLNTTTKNPSGDWVPEDATDWRTERVDLSSYISAGQLMVKIETANGNGDNLYLDNVNVFDNSGPLGIRSHQEDEFVMYPNPVTDGRLHFNAIISGSIHTITGAQIATFAHQNTVDVSRLKPGIYVVTNSQTNQVYKLVVR
tara:strand:+ start:79836 stop:82409 length:2574 start_codon:yes stop_codon:yes gene_type:complete